MMMMRVPMMMGLLTLPVVTAVLPPAWLSLPVKPTCFCNPRLKGSTQVRYCPEVVRACGLRHNIPDAATAAEIRTLVHHGSNEKCLYTAAVTVPRLLEACELSHHGRRLGDDITEPLADRMSDQDSFGSFGAVAAFTIAGAAGTAGAFSAARKLKKQYVYSQIEMVPV
jgi:hypothetical protein